MIASLVFLAAPALVVVFGLVASASADTRVTAAGHPAEGKLESFLGEPKLEVQKLFNGDRFPNMLVGVDGTVIALFGKNIKARRSEDGGKTWGPAIHVVNGFTGGGAIVNETNGEILAFAEEHLPPAKWQIVRSKDNGKTWAKMDYKIHPDVNGNILSMHMNEVGITLRHGKHAGRLIRAARHYWPKGQKKGWPEQYTSAIYSDDGGKTWFPSKPLPEKGTGEAAIAELSDGTIYYNSRCHRSKNMLKKARVYDFKAGERETFEDLPLRRRCAYSDDGGATYRDWQIVQALPDGPQNHVYGCMGGLTRLPVKGKDILIYSNCDSPGGRRLGTVWASFDGGKTWPVKRLVEKGDFAYSSLNAGRPGTKSEGWIYLNYESRGCKVARFNLSWLLQGEKTGDGSLPEWIQQGVGGARSHAIEIGKQKQLFVDDRVVAADVPLLPAVGLAPRAGRVRVESRCGAVR